MYTPTNAPPRHFWSSRHSSGPGRVATPYPVEDLNSSNHRKSHLLLHAGFIGAFTTSPITLPFRVRGIPVPRIKSGAGLTRAFASGFLQMVHYCSTSRGKLGISDLPSATLRLRQAGSGLCLVVVSQFWVSPYSSRAKPGTQPLTPADAIRPGAGEFGRSPLTCF